MLLEPQLYQTAVLVQPRCFAGRREPRAPCGRLDAWIEGPGWLTGHTRSGGRVDGMFSPCSIVYGQSLAVRREAACRQ